MWLTLEGLAARFKGVLPVGDWPSELIAMAERELMVRIPALRTAALDEFTWSYIADQVALAIIPALNAYGSQGVTRESETAGPLSRSVTYDAAAAAGLVAFGDDVLARIAALVDAATSGAYEISPC